MDSKGYIKDPSLRIIPSKKLIDFIKNLDIKDLPLSLKKFVGSGRILNGDVNTDSINEIKTNCYLQSKDYELLKSILKENTTTNNNEKIKPESKIDANKNDKDSSKQNGKIPETNKSDDLKIENCLFIKDLEWLSSYLEKSKEGLYLHELLEGSEILLPENETIKRNPVLEARCVRLRKEQSDRDYRSMTKNVDNVRKRQPEDTIAYQMKAINTHLIAIFQFILSVGAGFLFGFIGIELMIGDLDFGFRLLLGVMCSLIIALAEIYFLAKKLNEDLAIEETVQVGGPPIYPKKDKSHLD